ncbi:hypothetical protein, partial [Vibrio cholerae]|uniref:hypothetical protein n=1 Tax=Vibrio cholerae TaxID=666 RepID=UPI001BAF7B78
MSTTKSQLPFANALKQLLKSVTLRRIKTTQADRDLFKHLITESTNYVAADYMRHANDRRNKV